MKKILFCASLLIISSIFADEPSKASDIAVETPVAPKPMPPLMIPEPTVVGSRSPAQMVGIQKREEPQYKPMPPLAFPVNVGDEDVITDFGSMPTVPAKHPEIPQNVKSTAPQKISYVRKAPRIALPSKTPEEIKKQDVVSVG